ncbi:hypothetical protein KUCAC02_003615 [Chaenocephalus aceratus]|uniref:Uncharacterized protein n=1 Tax=Chaenocephalus aceratus TaxID=36190 RepID=A0ACB9WMT2_CHAAC|nr:hypothetical protein KUCAC02_003615 [Chaenocephalus aceratus]
MKFCPITTRSPVELDYGSGQGALCFVNPLFLQSRMLVVDGGMLKRSLKIRIFHRVVDPAVAPARPSTSTTSNCPKPNEM